MPTIYFETLDGDTVAVQGDCGDIVMELARAEGIEGSAVLRVERADFPHRRTPMRATSGSDGAPSVYRKLSPNGAEREVAHCAASCATVCFFTSCASPAPTSTRQSAVYS